MMLQVLVLACSRQQAITTKKMTITTGNSYPVGNKNLSVCNIAVNEIQGISSWQDQLRFPFQGARL
jgi:hypothetical protein